MAAIAPRISRRELSRSQMLLADKPGMTTWRMACARGTDGRHRVFRGAAVPMLARRARRMGHGAACHSFRWRASVRVAISCCAELAARRFRCILIEA